MDKYKKLLLLCLIFLIRVSAMAQVSAGDENKQSLMASEGKIYVVLAIVLIILAGLILYVFRLDRKISRMEKGENL